MIRPVTVPNRSYVKGIYCQESSCMNGGRGWEDSVSFQESLEKFLPKSLSKGALDFVSQTRIDKEGVPLQLLDSLL